jgi:nitroreductase
MNITVVNNRETIESALPFIEGFLNNIVKWIDHPIASRMIKKRNSAETFNTIKNHLYPISAMGNYKLEYGNRITRDAPCLILFHAPPEAAEHTHNSMIYATYTMLAALSLGLGACMNGIVPNAINKVKQVREIFRVPEDHEAIIALVLGYPKYTYRKAIRRPSHTINWLPSNPG